MRRLFEPLGYEVEVAPIAARPAFPSGATAATSALRAPGDLRLAALLTHLYVLLPVLDDEKHYWVDDAEVEKLLRARRGLAGRAPGARADHAPLPQARAAAVRAALAPLADEADAAERRAEREEALEERVSLRDQRLGAVQAVLQASGAQRVLDLGCGAGRAAGAARARRLVTEIVGVDVSPRALEIAARRLQLDRLPSASATDHAAPEPAHLPRQALRGL